MVLTPTSPETANADIALSDEAIDWLVALNSGDASDATHAAFAEWRERSAQHEAAAREAETIWHGIGMAGGHVRDHKRSKLTRRALLSGGALAVVGTAIAGSGILLPALFADHSTGVAEQRLVKLPDGSSAMLNASSALSLDFQASERKLILHQGQATFSVAHDANRPFVVEGNGGRTRAIGTVFDVDIRPDEVVVTVVEGVVAVATNSGGPVTARLNERVRYMPNAVPGAAEPIDAATETAWRRGKLIFNRRPLGDVVAEIERYRPGRIFIASERLRTLEVTGVFELNDPETILRMVEETLPVRISRLPYVTVIR